MRYALIDIVSHLVVAVSDGLPATTPGQLAAPCPAAISAGWRFDIAERMFLSPPLAETGEVLHFVPALQDAAA